MKIKKEKKNKFLFVLSILCRAKLIKTQCCKLNIKKNEDNMLYSSQKLSKVLTSDVK